MDPPEDGKTLTAVFRPTHPVEWRSTEGEVAWISGLGWIVAKERQLCWAWGKAASTHRMWVARHPGDTQLSSQTQVYHIEHHVESAWAPYVYRHVLISLFLSQNITFVKLQGVKIIRNNANFHTKKKTLLIKKDKQLLLLHLLRMAAAVISIWVQVYGERTFCFSGVTLLRSTCLRPYITWGEPLCFVKSIAPYVFCPKIKWPEHQMNGQTLSLLHAGWWELLSKKFIWNLPWYWWVGFLCDGGVKLCFSNFFMFWAVVLRRSVSLHALDPSMLHTGWGIIF